MQYTSPSIWPLTHLRLLPFSASDLLVTPKTQITTSVSVNDFLY